MAHRRCNLIHQRAENLSCFAQSELHSRPALVIRVRICVSRGVMFHSLGRLTPDRPLALSLTHTLTHALSRALSLSRSSTLSRSLSVFLSLTHTLTHSLSRSLSMSHSLALSFAALVRVERARVIHLRGLRGRHHPRSHLPTLTVLDSS